MSDFDHLKDRLKRGYISRRNFVRSAVALGVTASTAISFARTSYASDGDKLVEAREGFPVTRRAKLRHPGLDGKVWNADDPVDMFNYTVALLNSAIKDAVSEKKSHPLEDAFLAYAVSLAASESWAFDKHKNPVQSGWANANPPTLEKNATKLAENAVRDLAKKDDEVQARWALAIVYMNFGRTKEAVKQYKLIAERLDGKIPTDEKTNFAFEMADAYVHAGWVDEAIAMLASETARVDWHLHQLAWCYFVRAGRQKTPIKKLRDYDIALSFLDKRQNGPGDVGHLALADLLEAACYGQKAVVFGDEGEDEAQTRLRAKAKARVTRVRADNANYARWTVTEAENYAPFSESNAAPRDASHWVEAVKRAGIPQKY